MATIVRGKNLEITPALKDHVEKQEKKVTKYFDNEVNVQMLEARQDSTLVFVFDEFLDFRRLEGFDEFLDFRTIFIAFTDDEDVGVRRILRFQEERVFQRIETGFHSKVGIDQGDVYVIDGTGNLSGFEFDELKVFIVLFDVLYGRRDVTAVFQADETGTLQNEEGTAAVGRVIRDGDFGAVSDVFQVLDFMGINAHRFDMDLGDGFQFCAVFAVEFVEVR